MLIGKKTHPLILSLIVWQPDAVHLSQSQQQACAAKVPPPSPLSGAPKRVNFEACRAAVGMYDNSHSRACAG